MSPLVYPTLGWGLVNGFSHCIGMCGIFVLSANSLADQHKNKVLALTAAQASFQLGRLISLVALGAIAGALGSLAGFRGHVPAVQGIVAVIAGAVLAVFSLGQFGIVKALRIPEPNVMEMGGGRVRRLYSRAIASRSAFKPLIIGALVGLLPCGLTYYALIYVIGSLNALQGAEAMALFTLGTAVGLSTLGLAVGAGSNVLRSGRIRDILGRASGVVMLAMAAVLIYRGWAVLHALI